MHLHVSRFIIAPTANIYFLRFLRGRALASGRDDTQALSNDLSTVDLQSWLILPDSSCCIYICFLENYA
jgi:hypothetical protein